jgi:RNA polymerase sigma-70 factor (ECF subfamily)
MKIVSRDLRTLFSVGAVGLLSDGQLLGRFAARREEAAFEALVRRHGPMVWGVCRRILRNPHDAEDAFQATFLVLARKAASIAQREMVANWLYAVAYKTAMRASAMASRRRARERQVTEMPEPEAAREVERDDLLSLLDQELSRLPEKYRTPIVLCELEGKTHKEAASQLGWPVGTLSGRLSRARSMLAKRLARRGVSLSVGSLAVLLAREPASASMPTSLVVPTVKAVCLVATGQTAAAGLVSIQVVNLSEGVMKVMLLSKFKLFVALVILGVMGAAMAGAWQTAREARPVDDKTPERSVEEGAVMRELKRLRGTWIAVLAEVQGERVPDEEIRRGKIRLVITGDEFILKTDGKEAVLQGTLTIDPTRQPSTMDWSATRPEDGRVMKAEGIYELEGDTLRFCYGKERPEGFETNVGNTPGYSRRLYVFERQ